jgi:hypothetical protein
MEWQGFWRHYEDATSGLRFGVYSGIGYLPADPHDHGVTGRTFVEGGPSWVLGRSHQGYRFTVLSLSPMLGISFPVWSDTNAAGALLGLGLTLRRDWFDWGEREHL